MEHDSTPHLTLMHQLSDPYGELPMAIRQYYSRDEYLCLTDDQKTTLLRDETEPDIEQ